MYNSSCGKGSSVPDGMEVRELSMGMGALLREHAP